MFDHLRTRLAARAPRAIQDPGLTPAAVLVPFLLRDGLPHLLLQLRTETVDHHKGQISFPGGVRDPGDGDAVATALREAEEEVGLDPGQVDVLGRLDDTRTITGFRISPVVGRVPFPYDFRLSPGEVERLLVIPWAVFAEGRTHRRERFEHEGKVFEVDFFDHQGLVVWGATARIIRDLVALAAQGPQEAHPQGGSAATKQ
jgi:8-oxo-dGTP pyrophosphatase MutT (NUDIX family)